MKAPDFNDIHRMNGTDAARQAFDDAFSPGGDRPWWRDPATIPPRQFLHGRHYIRRAISATIAGGGRGKTTLGCFEAVTMAAGFDLATREPLAGGPLRVWLGNGEEDQDELDRRVAAVCQRYRISEADLGGRLFVQSVRDLRIATTINSVATIDSNAKRRMVDFILDNRIDVFVIDPLVSFHDVPENDNAAMDKVIKQGFGAVAAETNAAGELFHHPGKPKPGQAETVVEDGRGASAILWAVRSARVLNFMSPTEAAQLGMSEEERRLYIRITNGKANMGPLGKAKWMKIEVENLANGDQVACASSWTPPNPFQGVTAADVELAQQLAQTGAYRDDSRSPDWFGYALAKQLGINVTCNGANNPKDLAKLKSIIKTWKQNNVLAVEQREGEHRKPKAYIVPGPAASGRVRPANYDDDEAVLH
jgi:RecA-family ATPase